MKIILSLSIALLLVSSCCGPVSKIYFTKDFSAENYNMTTSLRWQSFHRILTEIYLPGDWTTKNRIDGYGGTVVIKVPRCKQKKVKQLLDSMWVTGY